MTQPDQQPLRAALWMVGAIASFSAMTVAGREISIEMNTFELMFYRSIIGFGIVIAIGARSRRGLAQVRTARMPLHIVRNIFHFTAQNLWFWGITVIPLSQLVALEFTNPIWVALLAPFLLGERLTAARLTAALLGFIGILIIARPDAGGLSWGQLAGLGAALGFAMNSITTKKLSRTDSVICVLFWMTFYQTLFGLALSLPGGIPWPSLAVAPWIVIVAISGLSAHYCLTSALHCAPVTLVAPMEFARLPVIAIIGAVIYSEPLMAAVFIGAGFIFAGNLVSLRSERRRQKVPQ
ncbi:DMT family transporter [Oceanomicrobium pacificus]|uniref:EamA family transporter n=1 Tax=Oceanomicrobium pacificus TaxID=2692916 RepID=A0A6B0TY30_9RHOB|nr:DMT family transporter [Oceanomicrobium pacificus]MXU66192.1 EamA family transporter [Oceanomicrobium pacificus]